MENNIVDLSEYVDAVLADESNILIVPDDRREAVLEIVAEERKLQLMTTDDNRLHAITTDDKIDDNGDDKRDYTR